MTVGTHTHTPHVCDRPNGKLICCLLCPALQPSITPNPLNQTHTPKHNTQTQPRRTQTAAHPHNNQSCYGRSHGVRLSCLSDVRFLPLGCLATTVNVDRYVVFEACGKVAMIRPFQTKFRQTTENIVKWRNMAISVPCAFFAVSLLFAAPFFFLCMWCLCLFPL